MEWAGVAEDKEATLTASPVDPWATRSMPTEGVPNPFLIEGIGTVIAGRYTLLEVIGEGGMGSVYMAQQDEPVRRRVALKLIKPGMDSRQVIARFEAERQALALMDHPNIARVYDGGTTDTGRPYFVMELVQGDTITKYCDQHRLAPPAPSRAVRAGLPGGATCSSERDHPSRSQAVERAGHHHDGRPVPKVIDFGVAKAIEQRLTDQSFADTGMLVGTPAYMSPEQADPTQWTSTRGPMSMLLA